MPVYEIEVGHRTFEVESDDPRAAIVIAQKLAVLPMPRPSGEGSETPSQSTPAGSVPPGGAVGGAMRAAPAIVATANRAAGVAGRVAKQVVSNRYGPATVAGAVAGDVVAGNPKRAATTAATAAVASQIPRALQAVQNATSPAAVAGRDARGRFTSTGRVAGPVARAANAVSRVAPVAGVAVETVFGDGSRGHRPAGETPATTDARQFAFALKFKNDVNREAGAEIITGNTAEEIIDSIARYRAGR